MDVVTLFSTATLMMLLTGGVLGLMHRTLAADIQPSAADWRIGTLLIAGGSVLLAMQRHYPPGFVLPLGNGLMGAGMALYLRSVRRFNHWPDVWWIWLLPGVGVLGVFWFAHMQPSLNLRSAIMTLVMMALMLISAQALWLGAQSRPLFSARVLIAIFVILSLLMTVRVMYSLSAANTASLMVDSQHPAHLFGAVATLALPVLGTTVFSLMCSERMQRQWKLAANVDHLTGIANRMAVQQAAEARFEAARREGGSLALLVVDVDRFKSINDRFGHGVGDRALVHVAQLLHRLCPQPHRVGRYGGEEFLVLLEASSPQQTLELAEQLRRAIESTPLTMREAAALPITVSIGAAVLQATDAHVDDTVRRADGALYAAKEGGRNQVVMG